MAQPASIAVAPHHTSSAKLYSYLVTAIGPVMRIQRKNRTVTLRFRGRLTKKFGGWTRDLDVVVDNSNAQPDLIDRVEAALENSPVRLLISFDRVAVGTSKQVRYIQTLARVEDIVVAHRDQRQLTLL